MVIGHLTSTLAFYLSLVFQFSCITVGEHQQKNFCHTVLAVKGMGERGLGECVKKGRFVTKTFFHPAWDCPLKTGDEALGLCS